MHELFQIETLGIFFVWVCLGFGGHALDMLAYYIADIMWSRLDQQRSMWLMIFAGPCYLAASFINLLLTIVRHMSNADLDEPSRWQLPEP